MVINVIGWVVLGLIAGFVATKIVSRRGEGLVLDIVLGIVGALVGGWLFTEMQRVGVTGFSAWSLLIAVVGSVVPIVIWHGIRDSFARR